MKIIFLMSALAAASLTVHASSAQAQPVAASQAVSTTGLDLGSDAGVRALDLRILHAASELCGTPSLHLPGSATAFKRCRTEVRANAAATREHAIRLARQNRDVRVASRQ